MGLLYHAALENSNNGFNGFSSMKCATSSILPVIRHEQNEVDNFFKSTSRLKSTNGDSPIHIIHTSDVFYFLGAWPVLLDDFVEFARPYIGSKSTAV